jgi:glycogenin glucosyltransferase
VNAWDRLPGIETYVRAIKDSHARRAHPQVLYSVGESDDMLTSAGSRKDRRESLIITDFPSAVERPSLPVTPAPRPTFWDTSKNTAQLPPAEGVPDQALWVCPQCGFQSATVDVFRRHEPEPLSISTITASSRAPVAFEAPALQDASSSETTTAKSLGQVSTVKALPNPDEPQYRSGFSARGAPLASLTDPSLLMPPSPTRGPSISSPSASVISSASASAS